MKHLPTITPSRRQAQTRESLIATLVCYGLLILTFLVLGCSDPPLTAPATDIHNVELSSAGMNSETTPLIDLAESTYQGFTGGLYDGTNEPPEEFAVRKALRARRIQPLDSLGNPDPNGKIVFVSASMSNGKGIWCSPVGPQYPNDCQPGSFQYQAHALLDLNPHLVLVNCSKNGQALAEWLTPDNFEECERRLAEEGLTMAQVQIVWTIAALKGGTSRPLMPAANSDAQAVQEVLRPYTRRLRHYFPNARMLYIQSRAYSWRFTPTGNSPHPWEYEAYYGAKWFILERMGRGRPGVFHGPYIYANGLTPRSDGLTWPEDHVRSDGVHPSYPIGVTHAADLMIEFFRDECWFLDGGCA